LNQLAIAKDSTKTWQEQFLRGFWCIDPLTGRQFTSAVIAPAFRHVEVIQMDLLRPDISHVIFDFDGTLSWLRHGWPTIMLDTFLAHTPRQWRDDAAILAELMADILSLNGKPSIHQLACCHERARDEGIATPSPENLLSEYTPRMRGIVNERLDLIRSGAQPASDFIVWNALRALENAKSRGLISIILSGTAQEDVRSEAELLGLSAFFGNHIYGSSAHGTFSKKDVIDRIMREEQIEGHHLLALGDGPVEIGFTKAVGGLAIGVASDEDVNGSHRADVAKRKQLIAAGADAIMPDYEEVDALFQMIFEK
jgi:phosphoglycolate phosphatase